MTKYIHDNLFLDMDNPAPKLYKDDSLIFVGNGYTLKMMITESWNKSLLVKTL